MPINAVPLLTERLIKIEDLNPDFWIESSDTSSGNISHVSNAVDRWTDKSATANNAVQTVSTNKPVTNTTTINGKNVVDFSGTKYLNNGTGNLITGNAVTIFLFGKFSDLTSDGNARNIVYSTRAANAAGSFQMEIGVINGFAGTINVTTPGNVMVRTDANVIANNTPEICVYRRTTAKDNSVYTKRGKQNVTLASNIDFVTNSDTKQIGAGASQSFGLKGSIGELIIFNRALEEYEIYSVIKYLKTKWGV